MRRIFCIFVIGFLSMIAKSDDGIRWINRVHDFGAFSEDDKKIQAYFKFINESAEDVSITQVAATCGCTVAKYDTKPIAPGDTAVIEVSYNPIGRPGRFDKQVYVRTTADKERYKLTIKGVVIGSPETIKGRYPVDMGALKLRNGAVMLGRVPFGHTKSEFIDAYNQSRDTIRPQFRNVPAYLQVSCTPEAVAPGEMLNLNFFFLGDKCQEWGIVNDSISISPNGTDFYNLPVVAIVEEDFSKMTDADKAKAPVMALSSDKIDLGDVPEHSKQSVTKTITITNRGDNALEIRRIYSQDPGVKAKLSKTKIKKGKTAKLKVTFDPSTQPTGIIDTRLTIITNDPTASTKTLRIVGIRK